jgi:serine/threonine-protein kinase
MLTTGQLLAERYRLTRRIAVGGMGEVWVAEDTRLGRDVAVKVLKAELSGDPEFLHRFRTEARTTASLNHPGIAAVHDYGETASVPDGPEDTAYLVMELVEGEPLAALVAKHGRLSPDFALDVMEQSGNALQAAHERGLVHRDVKPGNILIVTKPGGEVGVKITDFGIAKAADAAPVTRRGMVMGTAHYIAPEQATGAEAGPASDVYSLAVCGYECLAGRRPFLSDHAVTVAMQHIRDTPPPLPPDVPPAVRALIETTLIKDPRLRYSCGGEFANAVAAIRAGHALPPPQAYANHNGMPQQAFGRRGTAMLPAGANPAMLAQGPPTGPVTGVPITAGPYHPMSQRQRGRGWLWALIGVLVAALIGVGVWALTTKDVNGTSPSITETPGRQGTASAPQQPVAPTGDQQHSGQQATSTTGTSANTGGQRTVGVRESDYLGRPADKTADDLGNSGLDAEAMSVNGGRQPAEPEKCMVTAVRPSGDVPVGSRVSVTCVPAGGETG